MGDTLRYRIPNNTSVSLNGEFSKVNSILNVTGFFVSDFEKKNVFVFEEKDVSTEIHFTKSALAKQSKAHYLANGERFLSEIIQKDLKKAILSRVKIVEKSIDLNDMFNALCNKYPNAFIYLISSELFGTWIGATPEVLIQRKDSEAQTMSLAGTLPVNAAVEWSEKELKEQAYVTSFIADELSKVDMTGLKQSDVKTVEAGPVKHLRTDFKFEIEVDEVMKLVSVLHPTPAVSGLPRDEAIELIHQVEKHDRGFYSGVIGVQNEQNSDIFVNLRCAQVFENEIALYLGGGYTKDSVVEDEWAETEAKALTLLQVI